MATHLFSLSELETIRPDLVGAPLCIDVETNGLSWNRNRVIGFGFCCDERGWEGYVPIENSDQCDFLRDWLRRAPVSNIVGQNLKFDLHMIGLPPSELKGRVDDTLIMAHLLDSRSETNADRKNLGALEAKYLGSTSKREHVGKAPSGKKIWEWPMDILSSYCVNDARVTMQLWRSFEPKIGLMGLNGIYDLEMKFSDVLWRSERRGLLVDFERMYPDYLTLRQWAADAHADVERMFRERGIEPPNLRSPMALSRALYEQWPWPRPVNPYADSDGVDRSRFANRGQYNKSMTNSFILAEKAKHPMAGPLAWVKEVERIQAILDTWSEAADDDGYVHTTFQQSRVRTGRISSSDPALQNIPGEIRSKLLTYQYGTGASTESAALRQGELNLKRLIAATPGTSFVSIDHKQQEIRLFAILAQEPAMLEMARQRQDIHGQVARLVWGSSDPVHREWAKVISFGLIYGMTLGSLTHRFNKTAKEAQAITDQYMTMFPRVMPWMKEVIRWCNSEGMVRYWSGRVWREEDPSYMYRAANALIQGGAADLLRVAALRCDKLLRRTGAGHLVHFVHDELLFEVNNDALDEVVPQLAKLMEVEDIFDVPFFTDVKIGANYGELHGVDPTSPSSLAEFRSKYLAGVA